VDEILLTNFPVTVVKLDASGSGTGATYGTNYTQVSLISTNPPLKMVRVDCVWSFKGSSKLITNTMETCRAPDQ
jgi:hypothetical protein